MKIHPDLYHGEKKTRNFFEGWYFKVVDKTGKYAVAFIPGIARGSKKRHHHSFLQVVNSIDHTYHYHRFKPEAFRSNNYNLDVKVANNTFNFNKVSLNLMNDQEIIKGGLSFSPPVKWPDNRLNPGSMGFYNHFSFMECYSQVCAIDGAIVTGKLQINNQIIDFTGGSYYIEKNWGKSFPSSWLWIQSNNFPGNKATVTCSLGIVPFPIIKKFRGFLIGVTVDQKFYPFTTINRSKLTLKVQKNDLILVTTNNKYTLILKTKSDPNEFLLCYGPKNGDMIPLVEETLKGEVEMTLIDHKNKRLIYHGIGKACGIEYGGNQKEILRNYISKTNR